MKNKIIFTITVLFVYCLTYGQAIQKDKKILKKEIFVEHKKRPFYFRFPPKLKDIKSKKVIIAKIDYEHPTLGSCTYEVVKDLDRLKFFGWCNTKKIERRKTQIFELDGTNFKKLNVISLHKVELGLNENLKAIISEINDVHKKILKS